MVHWREVGVRLADGVHVGHAVQTPHHVLQLVLYLQSDSTEFTAGPQVIVAVGLHCWVLEVYLSDV